MLCEGSQAPFSEGLPGPHLLTSCPEYPSLRSPSETDLDPGPDTVPGVSTVSCSSSSPGQCDMVAIARDWSQGLLASHLVSGFYLPHLFNG